MYMLAHGNRYDYWEEKGVVKNSVFSKATTLIRIATVHHSVEKILIANLKNAG